MAISSIHTAAFSKQATAIRVVLAPFKHLWIAVPMAAVRKIMRLSDVLVEGEPLPATLDIDDLHTTVIDLYEQIYGVPNSQPDSHIVALQLADGTGYSLPMSKLPAIVNLDATLVKPIPTDYRNLYMLDIASHITLLRQGKEEITIFVIDPEKLGLLDE
jgi:hypothetical protein